MFRLFHKKMKSLNYFMTKEIRRSFQNKLRSIASSFTPQRFFIISVTCYINKPRKLVKWKMNLWLNRIFNISFKRFLIVYFISHSLYRVLKIKKKKYCQCSSLRDRLYGYYKGFNKRKLSTKENSRRRNAAMLDL